MRLLPVLAILVACDLPGGNPRTASDSEEACPRDGWLQAASSGMTIINLKFDSTTYLAYYDGATVFEDLGPAACYNPDTFEAEWIFQANDEPLARLYTQSPYNGNINMYYAQYAYLEIQFLDPNVTFGSWQFVNGAWNVQDSDPILEFTVQGDAFSGGSSLTVNLAAEMDVSG